MCALRRAGYLVAVLASSSSVTTSKRCQKDTEHSPSQSRTRSVGILPCPHPAFPLRSAIPRGVPDLCPELRCASEPVEPEPARTGGGKVNAYASSLALSPQWR